MKGSFDIMQNNIYEPLREYLSSYRYKVELHAHTSPCSSCSQISPKDMIRYMKEQKYDAVVITNHFYAEAAFMNAKDPIAAYLEDYYAAKEEGEKQGIKVLLGAEYRFMGNGNDYMVYGVDEAFLRETVQRFDMGIEAFYKEYHKEGLMIIQAHPFRAGLSLVAPEYLDGIEVMNMHPNHNSRVAVAAKTSIEKKYSVITIGTDLHHPGHEGISALRTKELPESEPHLVKLLRSGDYVFEVGGYPMIPSFTWL